MKEKSKRRVTVHIDSLVLKGFRHEDRYALAQGLQEQLTQVFSRPGMAQRLSEAGTIPSLRVRDVSTVADARPQQIGVAAANGIGKGLSR